VLTALITACILWTMLRWWAAADEPAAWHWIALLGLLFGLDFSVHRTNALLIPGALLWILIRSPKTLRQPSSLAAGMAALIAGVAVQLLIIPLAATTHSPIDFNDPSNWSRFRDYVTLKQLGGSFLLSVFPRKSDVWTVQVADVVRVLGANFFSVTGRAGPLGMLAGIAGIVGLSALWRANRRLALAFSMLLLTQTIGTVVYFNIPANYFRSFDRHYLPICVTIGVLMTYGSGIAMERAGSLVASNRRLVATSVATLIPLAPIVLLTNNWRGKDASERHFARDWAANALRDLPANAIYFTVGDNDTFPVMYVQAVEGVRRDVTIINLSVAAMPGYLARRHRRDASFPFAAEITPLEVLRVANAGRPVTYATTITSSGSDWPRDRARIAGLYWQVVVDPDAPPVDVGAVRTKLFGHAEYRGYADPSVGLENATREMGFQYYVAAAELFALERAHGQTNWCGEDLRELFRVLPPDRLGVSADDRARLDGACSGN
jgi:hypothetical protein